MDRSPQTAFPLDDERDSMDFGSAMQEVLKGARVRRLEWKDEGVYVTIGNDRLVIFNPGDKQLHPMLTSVGDMTGADWVVVAESKTVH